jgi:hypothetical protein
MRTRTKYTYSAVLDIDKNKETAERVEREIAENGGLGGLCFWVHTNIEIGRPLIDDLFLDRGDFHTYSHNCKDWKKTQGFIEVINRNVQLSSYKDGTVVMFYKPEWLYHDNLVSLEHSISELKHFISNSGSRSITLILITTTNESMAGDTPDDWLRVKEHCIDCHVEIDVF